MRILQLNKFSTLNGGSEVVADIVARAGEREGHVVSTLGYPKPGQTPIHGAVDLGEERMGPATMFRNRGLVELVLRHAREFRPDVVLHHNVYHHFPMAQLVTEIGRNLRIPQSIILHDHKPVCPTYSGLLRGKPCSRCSGGRFWQAVVHRCKDGSAARSAVLAADSFWNTTLGGVYSKFHRIICPSRFLARNVAGIGGARSIDVLSNPCPRVRQGAPNRSGIVFAGRMSEEKGLGLLPVLAAAVPEVEILVAGDGPLKEELERRSAELPNLRLLGRISRDEVGARLESARFLILPSLGLENNPMVGLEALATGTPILGSDRGGIPELVEGGRGILFDPSDVEGAVARIVRLLRSPSSEWESMHHACLEWAVAHSEEQYFRSLAALLR